MKILRKLRNAAVLSVVAMSAQAAIIPSTTFTKPSVSDIKPIPWERTSRLPTITKLEVQREQPLAQGTTTQSAPHDDKLRESESVTPVSGSTNLDMALPISAAPVVPTLSPLETRLNKLNILPYQLTEDTETKTPLTQFGYNFFVGAFKSQADAPVAADYIVSVGDKLDLTIWGTPTDGTTTLEVNRRGEISLPRIGMLKVAGLRFSKLQETIQFALSRSFSNVRCSVDVGQFHSVKVYVVGEVTNPGGYDIPALSTVINALEAAGGAAKTGSLRNVMVQRAGETVAIIDLYDFFIHGNKSSDIRLQSGDTVFVKLLGPTVAVAGEVKRPGIYEIAKERTVEDALGLAGGISVTAKKSDVQITRIEAHKATVTKSLDLNSKTALESAILDMDVITIGKFDSALRNTVRVEGHVLKVEEREFKKGMKISDVLTYSDLLPENSPYGEITRFSAPGFTPEKIMFSVPEALAGNPAANIALHDSDTIKIFSRWEKEEMPKVHIRGEVQTPGAYRLYNGMTLKDLVELAGNMKKSAYHANLEIARTTVNGVSVTTNILSVDLTRPDQAQIKLMPLDEITVRKIPNWAEETERYVELKGEFLFPGIYPITPNERLSSLIARAGGFTDKAYLSAAKFTRKAVQEEQQQRLQEIIKRTEGQIAKQQADLASSATSKEELEAVKASLAGLSDGLEKLKSGKAEGRVIISEKELQAQVNSDDDIVLAGGDVIEVRQIPSAVNILGQVYNPISAVFKEGKKVSDYLEMTGGFNPSAAKNEIYLVRANGTVVSNTQYPWYSSFMNERILPGDTIVVPQEMQKTAWMRTIKDITTILSQAAMTAGVIIAAGL